MDNEEVLNPIDEAKRILDANNIPFVLMSVMDGEPLCAFSQNIVQGLSHLHTADQQHLIDTLHMSVFTTVNFAGFLSAARRDGGAAEPQLIGVRPPAKGRKRKAAELPEGMEATRKERKVEEYRNMYRRVMKGKQSRPIRPMPWNWGCTTFSASQTCLMLWLLRRGIISAQLYAAWALTAPRSRTTRGSSLLLLLYRQLST